MKQLPDENELQKLVEMTKKFEQQIQEQCQIAGKMIDKYQNMPEQEKLKTNNGQ
jgi:hypothetical protein